VYALVVLVAPRLRPLWSAGVAVVFCWLVEFAQLTPVPADLSARSGLARLVLGSTFHPPDLFWYVAGVAVVAGLDAALRRAVARGPGRATGRSAAPR
jgi:hypothetical protein